MPVASTAIRACRVSPKRTPSPGSTSSSHPPPSGEGPGLILVGRFGAPQGVKGQVRLQSFTEDPLAIAHYAPLTDARGTRVFALSDPRPLRESMLVVSVVGVADRDAAAALTGLELFALRENLPPPDEDEVYVADLIGIEAVDDSGIVVGAIVAVPNYGAGDILELRPPDGGETLLVPFTKAFVPVVDVAARKVVVIVPPDEDGPSGADAA